MEHLGLHENRDMVRFHNDVVNGFCYDVRVRFHYEVVKFHYDLVTFRYDVVNFCYDVVRFHYDVVNFRYADGLKIFRTSSGTDGHLSHLTT